MSTLVLPVPPSANAWHTPHGRTLLLTKAARLYTDRARLLAVMQRITPVPAPHPVAVSITWYRARKSGDVDKRGAVLLDALQGVAYDNDSQIARYAIERDDSDPRNPRMVVTITELGA